MVIREAHVSDAAGVARVHVATWRSTYRGTIPDHYLDGLSVERGVETWAQRLRGEEGQGLDQGPGRGPARGLVGRSLRDSAGRSFL